MTGPTYNVEEQTALQDKIHALLGSLGQGKVHAVAYDTAWTARLATLYPEYGFDQCLEWLRRHQYEDGTWGASLLHYHDRFASTLAAIVALRQAGKDPRDARRIQRGERALWRLVGRLGRDDSDTVGFPIIATSLAQDAAELGLDVPHPSIRFAVTYRKKVEHMLKQPNRDWRTNALSFSIEGLWRAIGDGDQVVEANYSVASSPAATAAYLTRHRNDDSLQYLQDIMGPDGGIPGFISIDIFDIVWSLSHLYTLPFVSPDNPAVRRVLDFLWHHWSPERGLYFSSHFCIHDLDCTAAGFILLRWGGYPVKADVFDYYEMEEHFCTYPQETNPSPSVHLRLLLALQTCPEHPKQRAWMEKAVQAICLFDENGSYWWDKWHASPYYPSNLAIQALVNIDPALAASRLKWILKTQNDDGGWGYLDESTPEETAHCMSALLLWDRTVEAVDPDILNQGANFLRSASRFQEYTPLWISKGLYTPHNIVEAVILSTLFECMELQ
jgi:halimadienyl-diphosphate synthase